jgi:hypothetical protein
MRRVPLRAARSAFAGVALTALQLAALPAAGSPEQSPPRRPAPKTPAARRPAADTPDAAAVREEQAKLQKLLASLASASEKYQAGALRFVCEETLIRSEFDTGSGRREKERVNRSEYLLAREADGRVVEQRRPLAGGGGVPPAEKLGQPEPFLWSLLFAPRNQLLFNYRLAGQEVVHFRLATVIEFNAILPFIDGSEITQWSGRAYVDAETLDLLRVEAEPSGQEIRLEAATRAYHQAFRLAGVPLQRRPRVHLHEVDFAYERDKLRLPSLSITRRFVATDTEQRALQSQLMQIFADYRMFQVETEETIRKMQDPARP